MLMRVFQDGKQILEIMLAGFIICNSDFFAAIP